MTLGADAENGLGSPFLSHALSLSLSLTHTHTHTHKHTYKHTHTHTHSLSPHTHSLPLSLSLSHTHTQTNTFSLSSHPEFAGCRAILASIFSSVDALCDPANLQGSIPLTFDLNFTHLSADKTVEERNLFAAAHRLRASGREVEGLTVVGLKGEGSEHLHVCRRDLRPRQPPRLNPQPFTRNPQPSILHPQPSTLNPQPSTLSPQPSTLNP